MGLTLAWWTELKNKAENKFNGKVAPETEFEKKVKAFEQVRVDPATLTNLIALNKITKALGEVEGARKASSTALAKEYPKLSALCSPNSRVLATKIEEERTPLETKAKELQAKMDLGAPQMKGLGPGGGNMRQKNFEGLQGKFKLLHDDLKKTQTLDQETVGKYVPWLKTLEKEVTLYCKDRPGAKQYSKDYAGIISDFERVMKNWGTSKMRDSLISIGKQLTRIEASTYIP